MSVSRVIKVYAVTAAVMLALDAVWLGLVAAGWYRDAMGPLMADTPRWAAAALFYLGYPAGLVAWSVWPQRALRGLRPAVVHGAALGLFAYGTYDLTAMAVIRDWPIGISLLDMAWGATASASSAAAGKAWLDRGLRG
jgi:uncharacterized membrane protein